MGENMIFFKKLFCKHKNREMLRWHYTHGQNGSEPRFIEAEYLCHDCGKKFYRYIYDGLDAFAAIHAGKRW